MRLRQGARRRLLQPFTVTRSSQARAWAGLSKSGAFSRQRRRRPAPRPPPRGRRPEWPGPRGTARGFVGVDKFLQPVGARPSPVPPLSPYIRFGTANCCRGVKLQCAQDLFARQKGAKKRGTDTSVLSPAGKIQFLAAAVGATSSFRRPDHAKQRWPGTGRHTTRPTG